MKIFKKIRLNIFAIIILCGTFPLLAAAEAVADNDSIVISGYAGEDNAGKEVTVSVYANGKEYGDLLAADRSERLNVLIYIGESSVNDDGTYMFDFNYGGGSGLYVPVISVDGDVLGEQSPFLYINAAENKSAFEILNTKGEYSEFVNFAKNNQYALGFYNNLLADANEDNVYELVYKAFSDNGGEFDNPNSARRTFNLATLADILREKRLGNIYDCIDMFGLSDEKKSVMTDKFVTGAFETEVTNRMSGRTYGTVEELEKSFDEAFVLTAVHIPDGYGNLKKVLCCFDDTTGVAESEITDSLCRSLSGKVIGSIDGLKSEILSLSADTSGNSKGGGSGSGSRSGGSKGITGGGDVSNAQQPKPIGDTIFTDISKSYWGTEFILNLTKKGIINGYADGTFLPENNITRAEYVKMMVEAFDIEKSNDAAMTFNDVASDDWFYEYVKAAYAAEIIKGVSDTRFGASEPISRQDMSQITYNVLRYFNVELTSDDTYAEFADSDLIADYSKQAVSAMRSAGIISGFSDGSFRPGDKATRAQAAKIICGAMNFMNGGEN